MLPIRFSRLLAALLIALGVLGAWLVGAAVARADGDPTWPPPPVLYETPNGCTAAALLAWRASGPDAVPYADLPTQATLMAQARAVEPGPPDAGAGVYLWAGWAALAADGWVVPSSVQSTSDRATGAAWLAAGPVVLETDLYRSEARPYLAADGALALWGGLYGRHMVMCYGTLDNGEFWTCQSSWGPVWNGDGRFLLRADDLDTLLQRGWIETATRAGGP